MKELWSIQKGVLEGPEDPLDAAKKGILKRRLDSKSTGNLSH